MRKLLTLFAVAIATLFSAQAFAQLKVGGKAGLNLANQSFDYDDSDAEPATNMRVGFHIGAAVEYGLSDDLAIQSGLLFTQKGFSFDLEDDLPDGTSVDGYDRVSLSYLEVPISVAYKISDFQVYAGPYVAFGIAGRNNWDYTVEAGGVSEDYNDEISLKPSFGEVTEEDLADDEDAFSAFDFGLNFGLGYQFGPMLVNAGYSLGLGNTFPAYDLEDFDRADFNQNNRVITVSLTYFFLDN